MLLSRLTVLCMVALVGVLIQSSSSKSVEESNSNVKSRSDIDIEEAQAVDGSKQDVNREGELTLIDRAVKNTGLTQDEIEEVEKRGRRRRFRRRRRRRSRSRRRRSRRNRNRRRRNRRRRSRQRKGRKGSRRKGSNGQSGGAGGIGSHIGSALSGGLDAFNNGLDLVHKLYPGNNGDNPDEADQNADEEENTD